MNNQMMEELIAAAGIPDNDGTATLLETLRPMIDRELYLQLENAVNLRVAEMQVNSFLAGLRMGASGQDVAWYMAEIGADLEALRGMLGDTLWKQRLATINGEPTEGYSMESGAILAEYRQKRRRLEALGSWGDLPGYVKTDSL